MRNLTVPSAAHVFNAVFVLSSFTCALNSSFVASRVLYSLALQDQTGPEWITRRLRQCNSGVPRRAILATAAVTLLGYMGRTGLPAEVSIAFQTQEPTVLTRYFKQRLSQISACSTASYLIVFALIGASYLSFFHTCVLVPCLSRRDSANYELMADFRRSSMIACQQLNLLFSTATIHVILINLMDSGSKPYMG